MKKERKLVLISFFVSIVLVVLFSACNNSELYTSSFDYVIEGNHVIVTGYTGEATKVIIPTSIDGYPVYSTEATFEGNTTVEEVFIEEGVRWIGCNTFARCTKLRKVSIPNSVQSLGQSAFEYSGIEKIVLPKNLRYVDSLCFRGCASLKFIKSKSPEISFGNYSVYETGIKCMQLKKELWVPIYYHLDDFPIVYDSFGALVFRIMPNGYVQLLQHLSAPMKALVVISAWLTVIGILLVFVILIRWLMIILGKDKATIYSRYNERFLKSMQKSEEKAVTIIYSKPRFLMDNLKYLSYALYLYLFALLIVFVSSQISVFITGQTGVFWLYSAFLFSPALIFLFIILLHVLKNVYYKKKKRMPKSTIRIRRLGRRHGNG